MKLSNYVEKSLSGLLEPDIKETVLGSAEIQKIFKVSNAGKIAGSKVINGEIKINLKQELLEMELLFIMERFKVFIEKKIKLKKWAQD